MFKHLANARMGVLATASTAVALLLALVGAALDVASGWGVQDFLGWLDHRVQAQDGPPGTAGGTAQMMVTLWQRSGVMPSAWIYLVVDSLVFVPLYGALMLGIAQHLANALALDRPRHAAVWLLLLALPAPVLMVTDLAENAFGMYFLAHLAQPMGAPLFAALLPAGMVTALAVPAALVLVRGAMSGAGGAGLARHWLWAVPAAALAVIAAAAHTTEACDATALRLVVSWWPDRLACGSHEAKGWLILAASGVLLLGLLAWLFGVLLGANQQAERENRGALCSALWDILVRSRYALLAVAMVAVLTLVMDQARDVVYAMAASPLRGDVPGPWTRAGLWAGMLIALLAWGLAVWMLVFSCWLWTRSVCQVRRVGSTFAPTGPEGDFLGRFAQQWARVLAFVPVLLLVLLCANVVHDIALARSGVNVAQAAQGQGSTWHPGPMLIVVGFGLFNLAFGVLFLHQREARKDSPADYYNVLDVTTWGKRAGFLSGPAATPHAKYRFFGKLSPYVLPFALGVVIVLLRTVDALPPTLFRENMDYVPTLTLAIVLCSLALWLCLFGWLSIAEVTRAVPWVAILIAAIGLLGALGWTVNHMVWPSVPAGGLGGPPGPREASGLGSLRMLAFTTALVLLLLLAYQWVLTVLRGIGPAGQGTRHGWTSRLGLPLLLLGAMAVLWSADHHANPRRAPADQPPAMAQRPALDLALHRWLDSLCTLDEAGTCRPVIPLEDGKLRVQLVTTEGGGIRAAAWTAFALQELAAQDPHFLQRTFSISGVSGGAVGAAVLRACVDEHPPGADKGQALQSCVRNFALTDLLAPLLSAWMFEDSLARVLPTHWCDSPGCGFLSRGAWFEQALESGTSPLRNGLAASRQALLDSKRHAPYLLLNATWVESGERAIASDLVINSRLFHGAKDQLAILEHDLALSSAAHNAARFPYVNALGAMRATDRACQERAFERSPGQAVQAAAGPSQPAPQSARQTCGHVADGGYFDNSGAQGTIDIINALQYCLFANKPALPRDLFKDCAGMDERKRQWLWAHLQPQVLMVQNGDTPPPLVEESCPAPRTRRPLAVEHVAVRGAQPCSGEGQHAGYFPERPVCRHSSELFTDFIGPGVAVINVSGVGANGILAQARQKQAVNALRLQLALASGTRAKAPGPDDGGAVGRSPAMPVAAKAQAADLPALRVLDLAADGVRYPLGWHLSPLAVEKMRQQAVQCARNVAPQARGTDVARR